MILKSFQIKNYKSFVDSGRCSVQGGVTILAGQNESGKSNILNALSKINTSTPSFSSDEYCFDKTESPEIIYWFKLSKQEEDLVTGSFPESDISPEIVVSVREGSRSISIQYSPKKRPFICPKKHSSPEGHEESSVSELPEDSMDYSEDDIISKIETMLPKFVLYQTLTNDLPDSFTAQDITKIPLQRLSKYLNTDFAAIFSDKNQQHQRNSTQKLSRSISEDFAKKYKQKNVRLEFDINSGTMSLYIRDKKTDSDEYGYSFQLSQRSTGLRWYLNFYIALKGEDLKPGDIILVDEPGMYLHPKAQQEMREILNEESQNNQIIYTTHSPYLIDADNIGQIRLVEKEGVDTEDGYNEISSIRERIHHSSNIDTLKPILDAIGYSLGSELNMRYDKVLICEGVSDYYYIKALEQIYGTPLGCSITHANGCSNIGKIISLHLGLGITDVYALVDSDEGGIRERTKLLNNGVLDDLHFLTTEGSQATGHAIEDIFNREWFLKEIFEYNEAQIHDAAPTLSVEMKASHGGAKYIWAKNLFDKSREATLDAETVLSQSGKTLWATLTSIIRGECNETGNTDPT